ncbi:unnamed protein product [Lampetra fluviatilis]
MSSHAGTCGSTMLARFGEPHVRRSEPDTGSIVPGGDGVEAKFKINFSSSETLIGYCWDDFYYFCAPIKDVKDAQAGGFASTMASHICLSPQRLC